MPAIKLLVYKNANKFCREVLLPHRDRSLDDFIHLYRDRDTPPMMGQATASAPREVPDRARSRNCFHYGKPGHFIKDCPAAKETIDPSEKVQVFAPDAKKEHTG